MVRLRAAHRRRRPRRHLKQPAGLFTRSTPCPYGLRIGWLAAAAAAAADGGGKQK